MALHARDLAGRGLVHQDCSSLRRSMTAAIAIHGQPLGLTPEQHAQRRHTLGASEIATAAGLNKYRSAIDLWMEKTGMLERIDEASEPAEWGQRLETSIARKYADVHGVG